MFQSYSSKFQRIILSIQYVEYAGSTDVCSMCSLCREVSREHTNRVDSIYVGARPRHEEFTRSYSRHFAHSETVHPSAPSEVEVEPQNERESGLRLRRYTQPAIPRPIVQSPQATAASGGWPRGSAQLHDLGHGAVSARGAQLHGPYGGAVDAYGAQLDRYGAVHAYGAITGV